MAFKASQIPQINKTKQSIPVTTKINQLFKFKKNQKKQNHPQKKPYPKKLGAKSKSPNSSNPNPRLRTLNSSNNQRIQREI